MRRADRRLAHVMKRLVSPGVVQITSAPGRVAYAFPSRSRPPCFSQLWRDCGSGDAFLVFSDGSIYQYFSTGVDVTRQILTEPLYGREFDFLYRRGLLSPGGYLRLTGGVPGGAVLVYSQPPYLGSDPGPCPAGPDWSSLLWSNSSSLTFGGSWVVSPVAGLLGDTFDAQCNLNLAATSGFATQSGHVSYNGPSAACHLDVTFSHASNPAAFILAAVAIQQGSTVILNAAVSVLGVGTHHLPFTVPSTGGMSLTHFVFVHFLLNFGGAAPQALEISGTVGNGP